MYLPSQFTATDTRLILQLMREHSFALLISNDADGLPFTSHLPLNVLEAGNRIWIEGHVAKANMHHKLWAENPKILVVFTGPHAYLSPSVYPDLARVPTWNYLAVHVHGHIELVQEESQKDALLKRLIALHEPDYALQWRSLDAQFQQKMLAGIVGFRITIEKLDAKFKLNQHRVESHAAMLAAYRLGDQNAQALALWMQRLGIAGPD